MKFLSVLMAMAAFAFVNGASEVSLKDTVDNAVQECIEETGIDTEVERKLSVGDTSANDENAPCFLKCVFERTGSLDKDGVPQRDVFLNHLIYYDPTVKKENLEALADKCVQEKGADSCETAFKMYKCYWSK